MVDTTYFPVGQFFAQLGLGCLGWAFVNLVTLKRQDPFTSGNGNHEGFKKMLVITPLVFIVSTLNTQRQAHDLVGYCAVPDVQSNFVDLSAFAQTEASVKSPAPSKPVFLNEASKSVDKKPATSTYLNGAQVAKPTKSGKDPVVFMNEVRSHSLRAGHRIDDSVVADSFVDLLHEITELDYLEKFGFGASTPSCKLYTAWEIFIYNFCFWNLSFIVGLNFTHLDKGPFQRLTLDPVVIATWGKGMWTLAAFVLLLVAAILYDVGSSYYHMGKLGYYILWGTTLYAFFVW